MAQAAYRRSGQHMGLALLICFGGCVAAMLFLIFLTKTGAIEQHRTLAVVVLTCTLPALLVLSGWLMRRWNLQRVDRFAAWLAGREFRVVVKPTAAEKTEFAAPVLHLFPSLDLQGGAERILWQATHGQGTATTLLFEHYYSTGGGKNTKSFEHTVLAWPAGHPELADATLPNAPWFFLARYGLGLRRQVGNRALTNAEFSDLTETWTLIGDAGTGARFLTPAVRAHLQSSPQSETWAVGAGWICCVFKGSFDLTNLELFLDRARTLVALGKR